ncbi:uncharacterized protein AB9X84_016397 [Acanthopagrus schlegelii]
MDASMMDAEGGRVHLLERRAKRLVVIVALQNLLVAACLLLTLYAYCVQEPQSKLGDESTGVSNIHIHFTAIAAVEGNTTLEFEGVQSKYLMSLDAKEKGVFYINCTGPYILYMDLCYMSMEGKEANGTLRLLDGKENPETLFAMNSSSEECKDTVLQKTVFIKEKGKARLQLESRGRFKLKNLTVGLSSLLGRQCLF